MKRPLVWVALAYIATLGVVSLFWGSYFKIFFYILSGIAIVGAFYRRKPMAYMLAGAVLGMMVMIPHYLKFLEIQSKLWQQAKLTLIIEEARFYGDHYGYYEGYGVLELADGRRYKDRLTLQSNQPYAAAEGQTITAQIKIVQVNPFWQSSGGSKLTARQTGDILVSDTELRPIEGYFIRLNRSLTKQAYKIMPHESAAIINAIVLGEDRGLDKQTRDALNTAALSHIVVVSGQHLVIAASIVTILFRNKPKAVFISLACGWGFAALTGFAPSILRGAIMFTTAQLGLLFGRRSDSVSALCLATMIMTAFDPGILLSFSFILSAGAVLGIGIVGAAITKEGINAYQKLLGEISAKSASRIGIIGTIVGAQFGVLPGLVYLSGSVPAYGLITNLLVLPQLLPLMLFGAAGIILAPIAPGLAAAPAMLCEALVKILLQISHFFALLPGALIPFDDYYQLLWLGIAVLAALLSLFCDFDKLARGALAAALLLSLLLGGWVNRSFSKNTYDLYTFQEFNTVVYAKDQAGVILGIPEKDELYQLTLLLKRLGIAKLEYAVATASLNSDQGIVQLHDDFSIVNLVCDPSPLLQTTAAILNITVVEQDRVDEVLLGDLPIKIDYRADDFSTPAAYIDRELIETRCKVIRLYTPLTGVNRYKINIGWPS